MDRLTKYSKETTHENGVCCTHFGGMECFACNGDCKETTRDSNGECKTPEIMCMDCRREFWMQEVEMLSP